MANFPPSLWVPGERGQICPAQPSPHPVLAGITTATEEPFVRLPKLVASEPWKRNCPAGATKAAFEQAPRGRKLQ